MKSEKILIKKFDRLNQLKSMLISRTDRSKEEIIEDIRDTIEDLELILDDFEYVNNSDSERENIITRYSSMARYIDDQYIVQKVDNDDEENKVDKEFTIEEIEKSNGTCGNREYIIVDKKVYDVTDNPNWNEKEMFSIDNDRNIINNYTATSPECSEELNKLHLVGRLIEYK